MKDNHTFGKVGEISLIPTKQTVATKKTNNTERIATKI